MTQTTLIQNLGDWLIDQALAQPDILEMFDAVCRRLHASGVPVARARLTWPTLHPLFSAETTLWKRGQDIEFEQFRHREEASEEWLRSPMKYMIDNQVSVLRRQLDGPNKLVDFAILDDLIEQGLTDYLVIATGFDGDDLIAEDNVGMGMLVTWAADRAGGFSDDDVESLQRIQRKFAVACKAAIQDRIAHNVTETYLGKHASDEVLRGAIRLGDGRRISAVVWYTDMRNSTALADTMPPDDFLAMLNDYFSCTAGSAIEEGGEVLDFIGDAVLAIFPYDDESSKRSAVVRARKALQRAYKRVDEINDRRAAEGQVPIRFGAGINAGQLMFGNIGVASRLAFSVIGPTINEVERIETMTKSMDVMGLVSREIAAVEPDLWISVGEKRLTGVAQKCELFTLAGEQRTAAKPSNKKKKPQAATHPN